MDKAVAGTPARHFGVPPHFDELPLPSLDGIRFIAVVVVIIGHSGIYQYPIPPVQGVTYFFVLSGFLITWLLLREQRASGRISLRKFYARRALRLLPAFYFFFVVYLLLDWFTRGINSWAGYASAFFYYLNYYSAFYSPPHLPMPHTWSLATEEQFYFVWPAVFKRLADSTKFLVRLLGGVVLFGCVYRPILHLCHVSSNYISNAFDARASQLATGCLLAVIVERGLTPGWLDRLFRSWWATLSVLLLLVASIRADYRWPGTYSEFAGDTLDPILYALLLGQAIVQSNGVFRVLNWAPIRFIGGRLSYSMYLWHWLVDAFVLRHTGQYPSLLRLATALVGSTALALVSYGLIERPFLNLKTRFQATPEAR
ncbi:MAG: acyltransferase [Bryobacteraceae bacterium]